MQGLSFFTVLLVAVCAVFMLLGLQARAQDADAPALQKPQEPPPRLVEIRLLPESGMIAAGQEFTVGIEQAIAPGWHTYWQNPGDSGTAPRITWHLPEGFTLGSLQWPAPHKMPYGPLMNFGYETRAVLLQHIRAPDALPAGPVTISADIEILVCKEECIPEYGTYSLTLNGPEGYSEDNVAYLSQALEAIPTSLDIQASFVEESGNFMLRVPLSPFIEAGLDADELQKADFSFFPQEWGLIDNAASLQARLAADETTFMLTQKRGSRPLSAVKSTKGIITFTTPGGERLAFDITADSGAGSAEEVSSPLNQQAGAAMQGGLWAALGLALLGGVVLNLMPCVFPVLSLKALSLVKIAAKSPGRARLHGLAYAAGIILSFLIVAGVLLALKSGGAQIGWGFQLQNPLVVGFLAYLLFIVGLNLAGVFEISGHFGNWGNALVKGQGLSSSFFAGVLATVVATPCTAPFMAAAMGYALTAPAALGLLVFAALGLGLALPYVALSFLPGLQHILPKPGPWMATFREFLAFPMFASAAWLVWVAAQQAGPMAVLSLLMGMVFLGFSLWLWHKRPARRVGRALHWGLIILSLLMAMALLPRHMTSLGAGRPGDPADESYGQAFTPAALQDALNGPSPVFVEMTAAWCITCKVNHALAIDTQETRQAFAEQNVVYLIGDWTNQDPSITQFLQSYGRSGVPLYVFYGAPGPEGKRADPVVLPQILTPQTITNILRGS